MRMIKETTEESVTRLGIDLFAVGKVLGHASDQSTQQYSHLANDTLLAAVEAGSLR